MKPLTVTAELANGYITTDPWSPSLDAILAWAALKREYGADLLNRDPGRDGVTEVELPLLRLGEGDDWYYACSSPIPSSGLEHIGYTHKRFDDQLAPYYLEPPRRRTVNTASGRYKNYRMPHSRVVAASVTWHCVGEEGPIEELLADIEAIGKRRGSGHGRVVRWDVGPGTEETERLAREHRPVPGVEGLLMLDWGIRSPGWLVENRRMCRMPCGQAD